jgi:signal peptidase I
LETTPHENQAEPQVPAQEKTDWKHVLLDLLETVGLAVVLFLVINALSARVRVDGFSMMPTLQDGEFVLVNKMAYHIGSPMRGDIIVFQSTTERNLDLIKRVIGLPGDHIVIGGGKVTINGQTLNEPYIAAAPNYPGEWKVPDGYWFVLGDNRNDSSDSHVWGYLPIQNVIGKALLIYWPQPEWAIVDHIKIEVPAP